MALEAIRTNKMRSFLTMLGIIIGISSVIAISSIGASAQKAIAREFENFGKNRMVIYMDYRHAEDGIEQDALFQSEDIDLLTEKFDGTITYITPMSTARGDAKVGRIQEKLSMEGIADGYDQFLKIEMLDGRLPGKSDVDGRRECIVLEKEAALKFFGTEHAVGKTIEVDIEDHLYDLTVIGVFEKQSSIFAALEADGSYPAYVPYTLIPSNGGDIYYLDLFTSDGLDQKETGDKITGFLERVKHREPGFYTFESTEIQQGQINNVLGIISIAIGAIAAISLLVGGIGIMNIMLVSVTERTREIGIRKSLGATTRDILLQFLIESMIISAIGGVIGTLLGIGIASIGAALAKVEAVIQLPTVLVAIAFAALVGMFFGLYPARKAARLDPIEALRYE